MAVVGGARPRRRSERARARRGLPRLIPGGVNSPGAGVALGRARPPAVHRPRRGRLASIDADGNRYVDWVLSWGPLIAGHAAPGVVEAIAARRPRGHVVRRAHRARGASWRAAVVRRRAARSSWCASSRSGTEATMSALRLARAFTGRDEDAEVRRRLPRPRRRAAGPGRLGPGDAGDPVHARRAARRSPPTRCCAPYNDLDAARASWPSATATTWPA